MPHKKSTMTSAAVWVKLVIDFDHSYEAFEIKVTSETEKVDDLKVQDLKEAIINQTPELRVRSIDAASVKVYPPGTTVPIPDKRAESLPPGLLLSHSYQVIFVSRCCYWPLLLFLQDI
jgi:uncharacterized protein YlxW (UPF0749 family)